RTARKIRVHHDQIIFHLDDDVVAVPQVLQVAFAEPDARNDLLHRSRLRVTCRDKKRQRYQNCKRSQDPHASLHHCLALPLVWMAELDQEAYAIACSPSNQERASLLHRAVLFNVPTNVNTASSGKSNSAVPLSGATIPTFTQSAVRVVIYSSHEST